MLGCCSFECINNLIQDIKYRGMQCVYRNDGNEYSVDNAVIVQNKLHKFALP